LFHPQITTSLALCYYSLSEIKRSDRQLRNAQTKFREHRSSDSETKMGTHTCRRGSQVVWPPQAAESKRGQMGGIINILNEHF
jgi:hypothetical protein